jgi:cyd operon protein YbgT
MWYFAWILGLGLACSFAILNATWLELDPRLAQEAGPEKPTEPGYWSG